MARRFLCCGQTFCVLRTFLKDQLLACCSICHRNFHVVPLGSWQEMEQYGLKLLRILSEAKIVENAQGPLKSRLGGSLAQLNTGWTEACCRGGEVTGAVTLLCLAECQGCESSRDTPLFVTQVRRSSFPGLILLDIQSFCFFIAGTRHFCFAMFKRTDLKVKPGSLIQYRKGQEGTLDTRFVRYRIIPHIRPPFDAPKLMPKRGGGLIHEDLTFNKGIESQK